MNFLTYFIFLHLLLRLVTFCNFVSCIKFARQRTQKLFHYLLLGLAAFDMVTQSSTPVMMYPMTHILKICVADISCSCILAFALEKVYLVAALHVFCYPALKGQYILGLDFQTQRRGLLTQSKLCSRAFYTDISVRLITFCNFVSCIKFARQRTQKLFHYLLLGLAAFDMVTQSSTLS